MKNLKPLVFVLSIFFFFSCESEQEIFEEEQEVRPKTEQNYQSKASTYIRRGKLQQTQTVGYNAKFFVDNSSEQITSFALLLEGFGGSLETVIKPSGEKDAEGLEIYNWDLDGDGVYDDSDEAKVTATPLNEDGKAIAEPQVLYMTVEGNKQETTTSYIRRAKLKQGPVNSYKATFFVDNSSEQITSFAILLEGSGGSLETVIKPSGKPNIKDITRFEWDFDGDGVADYARGEEVKIIATPLNEDGKAIAGDQVIYLKVQADFTGRVRRVKIKRKRVGSGYKLIANITNNNNQAVTAKIKIDNLKGYTTTVNTEIKNNKIETTFNSKNEDDKVFNVSIILQDRQGQRVHPPFKYVASLNKSTPLTW
jgi:hypothetical protein